MWSEQYESPAHVNSGNPTLNNSSAAALLSYDVAHSIPWDWRVSLYTWTKGLAAGIYLLAALLVLLGFINPGGLLWLWITPVLSGAFLGFTGVLLIWDLEHPDRFYLIFTRPQWRSWLVRGAFIIAAYSLVLAVHFFASWLGSTSLQQWLMIPGIPLSVLTAVYTEPVVAATPSGPGITTRCSSTSACRSMVFGNRVQRAHDGRQLGSRDGVDFAINPCSYDVAARADDLGRSFADTSYRPRASGSMGDGPRALQH
jgi:hypothetical protein